MYGRFKPPGLFYDPELEESETEGPANITPMPSQSSMRSELEMQEQEQNEAAVVVGVDQGIAFFVCDFSTFCQANASVHYMKNEVPFVEH